MSTKTPAETAEFLKGLGLQHDSDALVEPAKVVQHQSTNRTPVIAPPGIDPRAMPVKDIVFDEALVDDFPSLKGREAYDKVFSIYKSYGKGERNQALHVRITSFLAHTTASRKTGGLVKEKIKATKPEREMAAVMASQGLTVEDLAEAIRLLQASRQA